MHDTGNRTQYSTGAVRDANEGKPALELISPVAEERLGVWLALGAKKYAARNWEKGIPLSRTLASLKRHILAYQLGNANEDHLAAILCNAMFLLHTDEMIKRGRLSPTLADIPDYRDQRPIEVTEPQLVDMRGAVQ